MGMVCRELRASRFDVVAGERQVLVRDGAFERVRTLDLVALEEELDLPHGLEDPMLLAEAPSRPTVLMVRELRYATGDECSPTGRFVGRFVENRVQALRGGPIGVPGFELLGLDDAEPIARVRGEAAVTLGDGVQDPDYLERLRSWMTTTPEWARIDPAQYRK
jgi:hypothetical protein